LKTVTKKPVSATQKNSYEKPSPVHFEAFTLSVNFKFEKSCRWELTWGM